MENDTYAEIAAGAKYTEARMHFNNDLHGRAEPPADLDPVPAMFACPKCGERDADRLWIDEDEVVTCQTCGTMYDISGPAQLDRGTLEDWGEFEDLSDRYALAHPGALM